MGAAHISFTTQVDYDTYMNKKNITLLTGALLVFLLFISLTSPYKLPLLFIIFPAIPLLVAVISLTKIVLSTLHITGALARFSTLFVALVCGIFFVLLSLGQVTFKDFFLLLALGLIGSFYVSRMFKPEDEE